MTSWAQTKNGSRIQVKPGARSCTIVTMKLIEPRSDDVIRNAIPISHQVWPCVAMTDSGAYDVQPEFAAPPGAKKLASMMRPPTKYAQ